jgi:hypothetical protein
MLLLLTGTALADSCQTATAIPSNLQRLGSGSATGHFDGETTVNGGQAVYVKVKNENVLGVSVAVTIARNTQPPYTICTYNALLPPRTSGIYYGTFFAEPPIGWKITVAVGSESDAGVLTYEVFSAAASSNGKNSKKKGE